MCRDICIWCVCLKTPQLAAGIEYCTSPPQYAASCSTGLQKAPLLLGRCMTDVEACGAQVHISLVTVWCLMLPLTFRCDSHLFVVLFSCLGFFSVTCCAHYILAPSSFYLSINIILYMYIQIDDTVSQIFWPMSVVGFCPSKMLKTLWVVVVSMSVQGL